MAQIRYVKLNNDNDAAAIELNHLIWILYPDLENQGLKNQ